MTPYTPTFVAGDLPAIGTDVVGTAGAATVSWIPLAVTGGVLYFGAKYGKKQYDKYKSVKGKGWHFDTPGHKVAAAKRRR